MPEITAATAATIRAAQAMRLAVAALSAASAAAWADAHAASLADRAMFVFSFSATAASDGDPDDEEDDPPEAGGDERDLSWHEWHTRGRRKRTSAGYEMADIGGRHGIPSTMPTEDDENDDPAEEDDPSGECSEDEISCGPGNWGHWNWREAGPGCEVSDPGEHSGEAL